MDVRLEAHQITFRIHNQCRNCIALHTKLHISLAFLVFVVNTLILNNCARMLYLIVKYVTLHYLDAISNGDRGNIK